MASLKSESMRRGEARAPSRIFESKLRVRYAETDQMGVVYHSNYMVWFEVGRVEMLRQLGFSYHNMEKLDDTHIAVVDVRCRYKAPARYDDLVAVRTLLVHVGESVLHFRYEILRDGDNTLLAEGESIHVVVNAQFKRIHLPRKYFASLKAAMAHDT